MDYIQTVTRALAISWRHKYLWLLAIFAGEATTASVSWNSGSTGRNNYYHGSGQVAWTNVTNWIGANSGLLWAIGLTIVVLGIALFLVAAVANGALVRAGAEHDAERPFGLGQAWTAGVRTFAPVLRLKLFAFIVGASLAILIGGFALMAFVFAFSASYGAAVATGFLALTLLAFAIPFLILFEVAIVLAVRAIVLDGKGTRDAFKTALQLMWRRKGRVALFWLLVWLAGVIASAVIGFAVVLVAIPLAGITAAAYFAGGGLVAIATGAVLGTAWLIIAVTLAGGVNAFTSTCWTLGYGRFDLQSQPAVSPGLQPA